MTYWLGEVRIWPRVRLLDFMGLGLDQLLGVLHADLPRQQFRQQGVAKGGQRSRPKDHSPPSSFDERLDHTGNQEQAGFPAVGRCCSEPFRTSLFAASLCRVDPAFVYSTKPTLET